MSAELTFFELFKLRESKSGAIGNPHPDTVDGPWSKRRPARSSEETQRAGDVAVKAQETTSKRTFEDCIKKWIERRETAKQNVSDEYVAAMRNSSVLFVQMTKSVYVEDVIRQKILAFRD